jgi:exodeoxyribonuclease-3
MSNSISIVSYNVNGIRAAMKKGWADWVLENKFDIVGIQEAKAFQEQVDIQVLLDAGYHVYWHAAQKPGYSGVAVFTKLKPDLVVEGMGNKTFDDEGRILRLDFGVVTLLNCYFPSGTSGDVRQTVKYEFLDAFYKWVEELRKERPNLIIQGDFNIAHDNLDIHDPKGNKNSSGFLPEERGWMSKWLSEAGFVDSFRYKNPDLQKYSWWSMRSATARTQNKGWRIDYITVTESLKDRVLAANLLNDAIHSDHCPCVLTIENGI